MRKLTLIAVLLGLGFTACRDEPPPLPPPPAVEAAPEVSVEPPVHPLMALRQAYGLPFPPEVTSVQKGGNFIEVGTKLRIPELEKFFRSRLVDYEFVSTGPNGLHIIGLRSTMPRIIIMQRAPKIPRYVRYIEQTGALARQEGAPKPERFAPGKTVGTKLSDGTPLAPGAVYGAPYTPKPGDPLYKEKYRANFGKPFGTWVLN